MILSSISDRNSYMAVHPDMCRFFDFILSHDLMSLPAGRIDIDGDNLYINVCETDKKPLEEQKLEVHRDYIDVQVPISAAETVAWKPLGDMQTPCVVPYDKDGDYALYDERAQVYFEARPGQFYVMFPDDVHGPIIGEGKIKKLIGKLRIR